MATLTEMVAAVVVHSSAAAFSHFGVTLDQPPAADARPASSEARVVARSPRPAPVAARPAAARVEKASVCPDPVRERSTRA